MVVKVSFKIRAKRKFSNNNLKIKIPKKGWGTKIKQINFIAPAKISWKKSISMSRCDHAFRLGIQENKPKDIFSQIFVRIVILKNFSKLLENQRWQSHPVTLVTFCYLSSSYYGILQVTVLETFGFKNSTCKCHNG